MLTRIALILTLAFQPLMLQGGNAIVRAVADCMTPPAAASLQVSGCCGAMAQPSVCRMHSRADACPCVQAPPEPARPTPAPTPSRGADSVTAIFQTDLGVAVQWPASQGRFDGVCLSQTPAPASHNLVQARLGVWRT